MKTAYLKIMSIILLSFLITGYGFAKEPLQPLTVQLDWFTNVQFAGMMVAKEKGWYEEKGIDLTLRPWQKGLSYVKEVTDGKAQIGVAEGSVIIAERAGSYPIRAIAVQFQKSPLCLISKTDKGIQTPENLIGKKVGISTPKTELMTKIVLSDKGIGFDKIIPIQTEGNLEFLIADKVDVFTGFMNNQPLIMQEKGYKVGYIPAFIYGYDFYSGVCFTTEKMITEQPKLIRDFVDVTIRGWKEAFKAPDAAAKLIVEKYYPEGSVKQQTESLKIFQHLATIGVGENMIGFMDGQTWEKGIDLLVRFHQIDKKIPATDVFTMDFLKK